MLDVCFLYIVNHAVRCCEHGSCGANSLRICEAKLDAETFAWEGIQWTRNWVGFLCAMLCTDLSNSNQKIDCTTFSPSWPSSYMDCFVRKWRWGMPTFNLSSAIYITQISSGVSASLEKKANCIAPAQVSALSVTINWYVCIWFASCHQKL